MAKDLYSDLIAKPNSERWQDRLAAVRRLAELGEHAEPAVYELVRRAYDADIRVSRATVKAIKKIGEISIPSLVRFLYNVDEDDNDRDSAAQLLAELGPVGVPALREAIETSDLSVRIAAILAIPTLRAHAQPVIQPLLQEILRMGLAARESGIALATLAGQATHAAVTDAASALRRAMAHQNPKVRVLVIRSLEVLLGKISDYMSELINASHDEDPEVREAAQSLLEGMKRGHH